MQIKFFSLLFSISVRYKFYPAACFMKAGIFCLLPLLHVNTAHAWFDRTHLAIAKAAEYTRWYNAAGADQAVIKAKNKERFNHFFNNDKDVVVTPKLVFSQITNYNNTNNTQGHLYGAILHALRDNDQFKQPFYQMGYAVHYIGDLSQPMHNYQPGNDPNFRQRHRDNDGVVDYNVLGNIDEIKKHMYFIALNAEAGKFEQDLATEIARIANISRKLSKKMKKEKRNMTREEAYIQLGHSASLLKAVLNRYGF